ncbi:MAG TPA: hypothetical protein PKA28_00290 [Methylomusa anaerophila]|uniref:Uncharacterized protein n=1 Tax=Methylomusa anaerophila TaxID=1930071 RepID=A0A348AQF2_9FIRM|nr:hypothetical protein [Methylomusa anaerophila]BBB93300.1 hypothetical protein MAMMFC1_04012 [Methylomusa anaerophila]HML86869.1 hypothetical protein [Methylomusa anaerophila]
MANSKQNNPQATGAGTLTAQYDANGDYSTSATSATSTTNTSADLSKLSQLAKQSTQSSQPSGQATANTAASLANQTLTAKKDANADYNS